MPNISPNGKNVVLDHIRGAWPQSPFKQGILRFMLVCFITIGVWLSDPMGAVSAPSLPVRPQYLVRGRNLLKPGDMEEVSAASSDVTPPTVTDMDAVPLNGVPRKSGSMSDITDGSDAVSDTTGTTLTDMNPVPTTDNASEVSSTTGGTLSDVDWQVNPKALRTSTDRRRRTKHIVLTGESQPKKPEPPPKQNSEDEGCAGCVMMS